jgi:hypothetical protein
MGEIYGMNAQVIGAATTRKTNHAQSQKRDFVTNLNLWELVFP